MSATAAPSPERPRERPRRAAAPAPPARRRGMVVALVGPDGAGKTTLAEALAREAPLRARRIYTGSNPAGGDGLAPHQWARRRRAALGDGAPLAARLALGLLSAVLHCVEERYRQALALRHRAGGGVAVLDRCALDLILGAPAGRPSGGRRRWLRHWALYAGAPRPDLVVVLDAPGAVLHARKGEHAPERLERMRQVYAALQRERADVVIVDAGQDAATVGRTVASLLRARLTAASAPATPR